MSYIRSGSNPEKLYIYGTEDRVYICEGSKPDWWIPLNIFNGLIRKYHRFFHDAPREYKGAKVEDVWVDQDNKECDDETYNPELDKLLECKVKLSYNDHCVYMWDVTWEYIVNSYIMRFERDKKVYVQYDPLSEKVICVHETPNSTCPKCKKIEKERDKDKNNLYFIEEKTLRVVTEDKLEKL